MFKITTKTRLYLFVFNLILILDGCNMYSPGERLTTAVMENRVADVKQLVERYPNAVNYSSSSTGMTPLEWAVIFQNQKIVIALLAHRANVNAVDNAGFNAMCHAIRTDNWDMVQMLVQHGATLKGARFGKDQVTPLMIAVMTGSQSMARDLLIFGCDPNAKDAGKKTAADYARMDGNQQLAAFLEKHMATMPTTKDSSSAR